MIGVMDSLNISCDFWADDAGCVRLIARPVVTADAIAAYHVGIESAKRKDTVLRADRWVPDDAGDRIQKPPTRP